jgi:hypothetical protein
MKGMLRFTVLVLLSLGLLLPGLNASNKKDGDLPSAIHNFVKGINDKSLDVLKSSLALDFMIDGVPASLNDMVLRQLVSERMPAYIAYRVKTSQKQGTRTVHTVTLANKYGIFDYKFETDSKDLITSTSLLSREIPKSLMHANAKLHDFAEIPIRVEHDMTLIRCELNGVEGDFLLRNSNRNLTINSRFLVAEKENDKTDQNEYGVAPLKKFAFAGATYTNIDAISQDLSFLERDLGLEIMGIVGTSVLEAFETHYDYQNSKLLLYRLDSEGLIAGEIKPPAPRQKLKIEQKGSQMLVKANLGKKNLKLAFDNGLQQNILNQTLSKKLERVSSMGSAKKIYTADLQTLDAVSYSVSTNKIGKTDLGNMDCVYMDMSTLIKQSYAKFDGYLGLPFFQNQKISINYRRATLGVY